MSEFKIDQPVTFTNPIDQEQIPGVVESIEAQIVDDVTNTVYGVNFTDRDGSAMAIGGWLTPRKAVSS